jgi:UDP-3-O-[3-hydroxymyristoyl] glucosamine N-acyltransferase
LSRWSLVELAAAVKGTVVREPDYRVSRPVPAGYDDPEGITFAGSPKYYDKVRGTSVGVVFLPHGAPDLGVRAIHVDQPRHAFGIVLHLCDRPLPAPIGVHPTAVIDPSAVVHPEASIGPYVVIGPEARIEADAVLHAFTFIGPRCTVGSGSTVGPRATLVQDVHLGEKCMIHPGAVLGADGFGFMWDGRAHRKIPQVGGVRLGSFVEVGANSAIDRATAGDTTLGDGVKLDNMVQIAHNVSVGDHSVFASQVGIAGSAVIGRGAVFGGQAGMKDHAEVGDGVVIGGGSGVVQNITKPGEYFGLPAIPVREALRQTVVNKRLPEILQRLKELERQIEALRDE